VEVDEQSDVLPAQTQIGQKLSFMHGVDCIHALDLNNHQILYQQVDSIPEVEFFALIDHRQAHLRFHP
jgi:hypothetical protein